MKTSNTGVLAILILAFLMTAGIEVLRNASANPWPGPSAPIPPIEDPPVIDIQSPINATYRQSSIPLNITVKQPDSWVTNQTEAGANVWVVGPNTLREVSVELDGQAHTLWAGTHANQHGIDTVCYYLPKIAGFSTVINFTRDGEHTLRVNVRADAQYYPHANFPFANHLEINASSATVTFQVDIPTDPNRPTTISSIVTPAVPFPPTINLWTPPPQTTDTPSTVVPSPSATPTPTLATTQPSSPSPTTTQTQLPTLTPQASETLPLPEPTQAPDNYSVAIIVVFAAAGAVASMSLLVLAKGRKRSS